MHTMAVTVMVIGDVDVDSEGERDKFLLSPLTLLAVLVSNTSYVWTILLIFLKYRRVHLQPVF